MKKIFYIAATGLCALMVACSPKTESGSAPTTDTATEITPSTEAAESQEAGNVIALEAGDNIVPGELPIVVDFWAIWCGPCMQFKPVFHDAAVKYASKATFATADVDQCKALAEKYGINSIPTVLIMMPDGTIKQQTGYMDAAQFDQFLGDIAK